MTRPQVADSGLIDEHQARHADNKTVYLVCGVSGSGKTWVCKQLTKKFNYVPHDEHYNDMAEALKKAAAGDPRPLITECPFGERLVRDEIESLGMKVIPVFVIGDLELTRSRYREREGKEMQKAACTRASTIKKRAEEWGAPFGPSEFILKFLSNV